MCTNLACQISRLNEIWLTPKCAALYIYMYRYRIKDMHVVLKRENSIESFIVHVYPLLRIGRVNALLHDRRVHVRRRGVECLRILIAPLSWQQFYRLAKMWKLPRVPSSSIVNNVSSETCCFFVSASFVWHNLNFIAL